MAFPMSCSARCPKMLRQLFDYWQESKFLFSLKLPDWKLLVSSAPEDHENKAASAGLPIAPIGKLAVVPNTGGRSLFAATFLGVYRSDNFGQSWVQYGAGLPTVQVSDLYIPADGSFLRASTYGRGVWDIPLR